MYRVITIYTYDTKFFDNVKRFIGKFNFKCSRIGGLGKGIYIFFSKNQWLTREILNVLFGRGAGIWTRDLLLPKQAR